MDSLVWIALLIAAMCYALWVEIRRHSASNNFKMAWEHGFANFMLTFSDGSSKCLVFENTRFSAPKLPILNLQFNQEYWIVLLHFEPTEPIERYPSTLSLHIEGVGKTTLRKERDVRNRVMYRAAIMSQQSLHYVCRRAVIGD